MAKEEIDALAENALAKDYHIHFHTWTPDAFRDFFTRAQSELHFPFKTLMMEVSGLDMFAVLQKL